MAESTNPDASRVVDSGKGIGGIPGQRLKYTNVEQYGQP